MMQIDPIDVPVRDALREEGGVYGRADAYGEADARWLADLDTPCYVFDPQRALDRYAVLREKLGTQLIVSLKANPHADMFVRCAHAFEDGIELASQGELDIVVGRGKHVKYLNNPAMSDAFIRAGLVSRCRFILDSPDVAHRFIALAQGKPVQDVLLRLNVAALLGARAPKSWHDHFGMTCNEAAQVTQRLTAAGIRVTGLHAFAGSGSYCVADARDEAKADCADTADIAFALSHLAENLAPLAGASLSVLSIGGGFSAEEVDSTMLSRHRARLAPLAARYTLAHEAGRAVFADAGVFVTRVVAVKRWVDRVIAVCDGGMSQNFLLAKTESILKKWEAPVVVPHDGAHRRASLEPAPLPITFVGSTCNRADVIGHLSAGATLPQTGDFAIFERCGAYHHSYSVTGFLSHKPARVYLRHA
jgi:diaminopimelate decarboxylase